MPLMLVLEPWGDEHPLLPDSEIRLEFIGPPGHSPLIEWSEESVTAYGWAGSTVRLYGEDSRRGPRKAARLRFLV
ncbi:MAG: hypothetical protein KY476_08395 [Planctomycetes bacterium]|nr:hypothetical protein [Planctomycetota bacterium]